MDTVTLKIEIVGLCLFATESNQLHVLLPDTQKACGMEHDVRLGYSFEANPDPSQFQEIRLDNAELDLSQLGGQSYVPPALPEVTPVSPIPNARIPRSLLTNQKPEKVTSRIKISSGEEVTIPAEGEWKFPGKEPRPMTQRTGWIIKDVPRDRLAGLALSALHGNTAVPALPNLDVGVPVVHLRVRHAPKHEDTCEPIPGRSTADHFTCFYALFPRPRPTVVPIFAGRLRGQPLNCEKRADFGDLLACMSAKSGVEP